MVRTKTDLFKINGEPMLAPDGPVAVTYEDLTASDSGRDEMGYMRRIVLRPKVAKWNFQYSSLSEEDKNYMESLFSDEATFQFQHPSRRDSSVMETTTCYRDKYGISWKNAVTGLWGGYSFNIIEC